MKTTAMAQAPLGFDAGGSAATMAASPAGQKGAALRLTRPRGTTVAFWVVTALFCLQMTFTAYAQLRLPQVAEAFAHLGFPGYFRVELSFAKLLGVALLLAPVPRRLKEWAYAGFAINLASAVVAHLSVGDGPEAWGWAVFSGALWALSYAFWRRLEARAATSPSPMP